MTKFIAILGVFLVCLVQTSQLFSEQSANLQDDTVATVNPQAQTDRGRSVILPQGSYSGNVYVTDVGTVYKSGIQVEINSQGTGTLVFTSGYAQDCRPDGIIGASQAEDGRVQLLYKRKLVTNAPVNCTNGRLIGRWVGGKFEGRHGYQRADGSWGAGYKVELN